VARIAAARVGPTGTVVGVDLNPGMLSVARLVALMESQPGAPLQWQETSADKLPFPDESFDIVYCQLGLQFFADRAAALREMRRVLAGGGRLALMVWRSINESPGFAVLAEALQRHVGQAAASIMRAPFGFSNSEELASLACRSSGGKYHARAIWIFQFRGIGQSRPRRRFSGRRSSTARWHGPVPLG
jgi:ubiquinone/menaquinone biosynthesis C-methylase UbiE